MTNNFPIYYDQYDEPVRLPWMYVVCDGCHGNGTHVRRDIDGFSTSDEMWQDDEFRSMYMSGTFDVACEDCNGIRVIAIPDPDRCDPELLDLYYKQKDEREMNEYYDRQSRRAEQGWLDL